MTNEQIAQRAIENAETAAQIEITDVELRDSLVRNFVQELDRIVPGNLTTMRGALQRIADSRSNKNWRKPEICDEADRALSRS